MRMQEVLLLVWAKFQRLAKHDADLEEVFSLSRGCGTYFAATEARVGRRGGRSFLAGRRAKRTTRSRPPFSLDAYANTRAETPDFADSRRGSSERLPVGARRYYREAVDAIMAPTVEAGRFV